MLWEMVFRLVTLLFLVDTLSRNVVSSFADNSEMWVERVNEEGEINVDALFGKNAKDFTVCATTACALRTVALPRHADKVLVFFIASSFASDPYLFYYLGMVHDYFKYVDAHFLILSVTHSLSGGPYLFPEIVTMLKSCSDTTVVDRHVDFCEIELPKLQDEYKRMTSNLYHDKLAFVILQDNILNIDYHKFVMQYKSNGLELFMLIHLNHERPWIDTPEQKHKREDAYAATRVVLRTHYYTETMSASNVHYLPLGAGTLLSELLMESAHPDQKKFPQSIIQDENKMIRNRTWLCSFAGSMKYTNKGNKYEPSRLNMINLLLDIPSCIFYPSDDANQSPPLTQFEFYRLTGSTIFSLCPSGVGPETNRPYQALEMGAIPIIVREDDGSKDFLTGEWFVHMLFTQSCLQLVADSEWVDYPGPIFSSWEEVKNFLLYVQSGAMR